MRRLLFLFLSATLLTSSPALCADGWFSLNRGLAAGVAMGICTIGIVASLFAVGMFADSCCEAPYELTNVNGKGYYQCAAIINGTKSFEQPYSCGGNYWGSVVASIVFTVLTFIFAGAGVAIAACRNSNDELTSPI